MTHSGFFRCCGFSLLPFVGEGHSRDIRPEFCVVLVWFWLQKVSYDVSLLYFLEEIMHSWYLFLT